MHSRVSTYDDEKYLRPYKKNLVDVMTSKDCLKRALDTASALFLALEARGHRVVLAPPDGRYSRMALSHRDGEKVTDEAATRYGGRRGPARPTLVFIDEVAIGLQLFELSENVEVLARSPPRPRPPRRAATAAGAGFGGRPDLAGRFAEVALIVPMRLNSNIPPSTDELVP